MTLPMIWPDKERNGGQKVLQSNGKRSIICNIGSKSELVEGASLSFLNRKALKSWEYHTEMNREALLDCLEKKVLHMRPIHIMLVLVHAIYHKQLMEATRLVKYILNKKEFVKLLVVHGVVWERWPTTRDYMTLTRILLAELCKKHKPEPAFIAEKRAKKWGCEVFLLPVGHPELKPMEMVWSWMETYVRQLSCTSSLNEVGGLVHERFDKFDKAEWKK